MHKLLTAMESMPTSFCDVLVYFGVDFRIRNTQKSRQAFFGNEAEGKLFTEFLDILIDRES